MEVFIMDKDRIRKEWLEGLRPGDKVANEVTVGFGNDKAYQFHEVKNVTKKGQIRLTNGILLDENGYYHKFKDWHSTTYKIEPVTDEILKFEEDRKAFDKLRYEVTVLCEGFRKGLYSIEDLKQIKELLEKGQR
jgi:hypothetical protein